MKLPSLEEYELNASSLSELTQSLERTEVMAVVAHPGTKVFTFF
jgi:hypothetical protein